MKNLHAAVIVLTTLFATVGCSKPKSDTTTVTTTTSDTTPAPTTTDAMSAPPAAPAAMTAAPPTDTAAKPAGSDLHNPDPTLSKP